MGMLLMGMVLAGGMAQAAGGVPPLAAVEALGKRVQIEVPARATYGAQAQELGLEGKVLVQATVGGDGRAHDLRIVESSGSRHLDFAALNTVRKTRFVALDRNIDVAVRVPVNFALPDHRIVD